MVNPTIRHENKKEAHLWHTMVGPIIAKMLIKCVQQKKTAVPSTI